MTNNIQPGWPHAPLHRLAEAGTYFVTVGTYLKAHHFRGDKRLAVLQRGLLAVTGEFGLQLEAWAGGGGEPVSLVFRRMVQAHGYSGTGQDDLWF